MFLKSGNPFFHSENLITLIYLNILKKPYLTVAQLPQCSQTEMSQLISILVRDKNARHTIYTINFSSPKRFHKLTFKEKKKSE
jgi:hypothetical protein